MLRTRANDDFHGAKTLTDHTFPITTTTTTTTSPSIRTTVILTTTHASLCIFWIFMAGSPTDDWLDLPFVMIMTVQQIIFNPIITIATSIAFALQIRMMRTSQDPSALSCAALLLPCGLFLALAVSWPFRFRVPRNLRRERGDFWWPLTEWYPQVGWTCINSGVVAIGYAILLCVFTSTTGSGAELGTEGEALLGN